MWNKTIYQTYECDFGELHDSYKRCCNLWRSTYPEWNYHFANAKDRRQEVIDILDLSPVEADIYDNYSGLIQSDFWRYVVTATYGGMYADLDSIPILNIEPILRELDDEIELVALPDGDQREGKPGSNNCNFVLKAKSQIANNLLAQVKQYFTINAQNIKNGLQATHINSNKLFADITILHKANVAQILDSTCLVHSKDFKPGNDYRSQYEKSTNSKYFGNASLSL